MDIKWQEPPHDGRGSATKQAGFWGPLAVELRKHPGKWALVREGVSSTSGYKQCRALGLRHRTVKRLDGKYDIYARYEEKP